MLFQTKNKTKTKTAKGSSRKRVRAVRIAVFAIIILFALFLILFGGYSIYFAKKAYANVRLGEIEMGGKNKAEISQIINDKSGQFLAKQFVLKFQTDNGDTVDYNISPADIGLSFDAAKTVESVYGIGRGKGALKNFSEQFSSLFKPHIVNAVFAINQEALDKKINDIAAETDTPEKDYELTYVGEGKFQLSNDRQTGKRIDQTEIKSAITNQIAAIKMSEISFSLVVFQPQVTEENANARLEDADKILSDGELVLSYGDLTFPLDVDTIGGLIKSRPKGDDLELYVDGDKASTQVEAIAESIDQEPKNALLKMDNGMVSAFQQAQVGRVLDQKQAVIDISNALLSRAADGITTVNISKVALKVKETQPEITSSQIDNYGLKELVATGTTNFRNSPSNRVHNITVGAAAINGTLLKPGEEFSTLGKLGTIDASTGYLPELVIKNNKTLPDYGGGLCQVSTTLFRTAMNAGMKITSRQNHSYRVSYYEPPIGMDATIFDPAPDFKFVNNYSSYILIQSHIEGTKITFDFYGTKDTRQVNVGTPQAYDYVEPPAPVYTVDPALPPGTENLVSHSHQGASAKFHYEVTREGETLQNTDFISKYVALPEQWVVAADSSHAPQPEAPPVEVPAG